MTDCDIEVIDIEKDNEEDIQIIETKNESQKSSEADDDKAKEINNENQGIVPTVNTIADDSDSDNDCVNNVFFILLDLHKRNVEVGYSLTPILVHFKDF